MALLFRRIFWHCREGEHPKSIRIGKNAKLLVSMSFVPKFVLLGTFDEKQLEIGCRCYAKIQEHVAEARNEVADTLGGALKAERRRLKDKAVKADAEVANPKKEWEQIEWTVLQNEEDQALRYNVGPEWSANYCAVDCTLFTAIMLGVARVQIDQIAVTAYHKIPLPSKAIRIIIHRLWGTLTPNKHVKMRNSLRDVLFNFNKELFPPAPATLPLVDTFNTYLEGVIQMSYTQRHGTVCCDGRLHVSTKSRPSRHNAFYVTNIAFKTSL